MSFAGMEMLNRGEEDDESSPWGGISSQNRGRGNSGSMKVGLLGGNDGVGSNSSSPYSPSSERVPLRDLVDGNRAHVDIDPSIICCTLFSIISATLLILLGIYGAADSEAKYLILVEGGGKENGGTRGAQVGHIIGAAVIYTMFAVGCGFRWYRKLHVDFGSRRQSVLNPNFNFEG